MAAGLGVRGDPSGGMVVGRAAAGRGGSGPAQTQAEELARITMCPVHACLDALRACGGDEDQAIDRLIAMDLMSF